MISRRAAVLGALVVLAAAGATAQPLDSISQDALNKTLQILLDPTARSGELGKNSQGAALDAQVRALAGSDALTQELDAVAGQVLTELVQSSGGDTQKMLRAVERAKTDPAGLAAVLGPATQQRLRDLSVKISDQRR